MKIIKTNIFKIYESYEKVAKIFMVFWIEYEQLFVYYNVRKAITIGW